MVRRLTRGVVVLGVLLLTGCSCDGNPGTGDGGAGDGGGGDGGPDIPGLEALRVEPSSATVVDDGVDPGETTSFTAIGTFSDGDRDLTAEVAWSLEDADLGELVAGVFTSARRGGTSQVVAQASGLAATADLTVIVEATIIVTGTTVEPPADAATLFPEDPTADVSGDPLSPLIVYPSHETMFPLNLERVLYQWRAGNDLDLFEVRFDSSVARLRWYTTELSLLPDLDGWRWLAATHAGGSVEMTVRGLSQADPTTVYTSAPITLYFSASEVIGALYYWSTGAQGVMRAKISSAIAEKFFTDPATDDNTCVSCHTVSRDGRRLSAGYGGEKLRVVTIPDRELRIPELPADDGPEYGWGTFNPGATRLLYASKGILTLLEVETGNVLVADVLAGAALATFPDWSPDGAYVAVAYHESRDLKNKSVQGTSLARIPALAGDTFGTPEVLIASTADDDSLYFPSYSPDSRWLAFVRGTGGSKDNDTSEIYLTLADGSGPILPLVRMNQRVRHEDGITGIGNAMPTWAPSTRPEINWLAISSLRDYGDVLDGTDRDQLWGVAIDLDAAAAGSEASYAAFWMPFQALDEGNHRAFWALADDDVCPSTVELCDGLDNDCDGIVDEDCCVPEPEICADDIDNDCDGQADEGCGCGVGEVCDNGIDDDCDSLTDGDDEDCAIIP